MEELSVSQLNEQFSLFIQYLDKQKAEIRAMLDFQMGTSSSFSNLVQSFKSKIVPVIESLSSDYLQMYQQYTKVSCQNESEIRKSILYENAYSEISSYLAQIQTNYNQLWSTTAAFASLLLQSDKENTTLRYQLSETIERSRKMKYEIENLQNLLLTARKREKWLHDELQDLLTAPNMLVNAQNALENMTNSLHNEREEKIKSCEKEITELKSSIQKLMEETEIQNESHQKEIEEYKNQIEKLNQDNENEKNEKTKLEEHILEKDERINSLMLEARQKDILESAINNFCNKFSFITFNGVSFDYQASDITQQSVLETTLENVRKERKDLTIQVNELKKKIETMSSSFENDIRNCKTTSRYEVDALSFELQQSLTLRDELISESRRLKLQITQKENEYQRSEEKLKKLNEQNQELRSKYLELKNRENKSLERYEANLEQLTGIGSSSISIPPITLTSTEIADSVIREANETLQKKNSDLEIEKHELVLTIKDLQTEIEIHKNQNKYLNSKLTEAQDAVVGKEKKADEWKNRHDTLLQNVKSINPIDVTKISELENNIKEYKDKNNQLCERIQELNNKYEHAINEHDIQNSQQSYEIRQHKDKLEMAEKELESIKLELEKINQELDEKNKQIELLEEKNQKIEILEEKNQQLKRCFSNYKLKTQEEHEKEINGLNKEIDYLRQENKEIKQNIEMPQELQIEEPKHVPPPEVEEPNMNETRDDDEENENKHEEKEDNQNIESQENIKFIEEGNEQNEENHDEINEPNEEVNSIKIEPINETSLKEANKETKEITIEPIKDTAKDSNKDTVKEPTREASRDNNKSHREDSVNVFDYIPSRPQTPSQPIKPDKSSEKSHHPPPKQEKKKPPPKQSNQKPKSGGGTGSGNQGNRRYPKRQAPKRK